jgi:tetratricopeptide (TPR) repeat protein
MPKTSRFNWPAQKAIAAKHQSTFILQMRRLEAWQPRCSSSQSSDWGNALQGKRDYDGAITKYKQALALNPNYADAYSDWGNALQGKRDY